MVERKTPQESEPVPSEVDEEREHEMNPVLDDEDEQIPGVVPPEGHSVEASDDEATRPHESQLQEFQQDLGVESVRDTQHGDGSTDNPNQAQEQGLVYEPPTDPPVVPSDDLQGAEVAAGLTPSMETSDPDQRDLPDAVDNADWDLIEDIEEALRVNSETQHLDNIHVEVENGIVTVRGTVRTRDDLGRAERVIAELDGVRNVFSEVELADESIA